jgi:hypothetical protein
MRALVISDNDIDDAIVTQISLGRLERMESRDSAKGSNFQGKTEAQAKQAKTNSRLCIY